MKLSLLIVTLVTLTGCTTVTYETADGTKLTVRKFQIAGEELNLDGTLEGIGSLTINKKAEDSRETAQALLNGLIDAAAP